MGALAGHDVMGYGMPLHPAASRVATDHLECLLDRQPVPLSQDALRLLDDDAAVERVLELVSGDTQRANSSSTVAAAEGASSSRSWTATPIRQARRGCGSASRSLPLATALQLLERGAFTAVGDVCVGRSWSRPTLVATLQRRSRLT